MAQRIVQVIFVLMAVLRANLAVPVLQSTMDRTHTCDIIFKVAHDAAGQPNIAGITMPPLKDIVAGGDKNSPSGSCNVIFVLSPSVSVSGPAKPPTLATTRRPAVTKQPVGGHLGWLATTTTQAPSQSPVYEDQEVVYPVDVPQIPENGPTNSAPLFEDQMVVFPQAEKPANTDKSIQVVENSVHKHANGTTEHKLVLSNGVVNYKKVYNKLVRGKPVAVQEGYNTAPLSPNSDKYQTQYYISDENGHQVYKVKQHSGRANQ